MKYKYQIIENAKEFKKKDIKFDNKINLPKKRQGFSIVVKKVVKLWEKDNS